jgi:hypothetical protein
MVSMTASEYEIMVIRCEERKVFRNQFELAYAELNEQKKEMSFLKKRVGDLEQALTTQRGEADVVKRKTEEIGEEFKRLRNKEEREAKRDIEKLARTVKDKAQEDDQLYMSRGKKRKTGKDGEYETPGAALEDDNVKWYYVLKCQEAAQIHDGGEVMRYAILFQKMMEGRTKANERHQFWIKYPSDGYWDGWHQRNRSWRSKRSDDDVHDNNISADRDEYWYYVEKWNVHRAKYRERVEFKKYKPVEFKK